MRKNLTFCLMLMASTLTIGLLAGCSEEVTVDNKDENDRQLPVVCDGATVFVSGTDATRTKIDNNALFYWVKDDQIWVDENLNENKFLLRSDESELVDQGRKANFTFNKNLSEPTYNLTYTGNGSTSGTKVTIKKQQFQEVNNNSEHIGTSGDCGVDSAKKVAGKYTFNLKHKAHYLIFQPYKDPFINGKLGVTDKWTLKSIDIVDTDGIPLSGTFFFGMDGLDQTQEIENANDSVRIKCGLNGFNLPEQVDKDDDAKKIVCYAVIAPAPNGQERRNLKIRYNIESKNMKVNVYEWWNKTMQQYEPRPNQSSYSFPIIRYHDIRCLPNGVSRFKHCLGKGDEFEEFSSNSFYTWDALEDEYIWKGNCDDPPSPDTYWHQRPTFFGFNTNESQYTYWPYTQRRWIGDESEPRSYNDVVWPEEGYNWEPYHATRSCQYMPDVNAASWYVMAGDPRYETEKLWCINGDYKHIYTFGVWFKKWDEIPGKPEGSKITECPVSYDGTDYRTTPMPTSPMPFAIRDDGTGAYANAKPATEYKKGRPSPSEIDKYFFLPALGNTLYSNSKFYLYLPTNYVGYGQYWLSSAYPKNIKSWYPPDNQFAFEYDEVNAYVLIFRNNMVYVYSTSRDAGRPAGKRKRAGGVPTEDDWFQ